MRQHTHTPPATVAAAIAAREPPELQPILAAAFAAEPERAKRLCDRMRESVTTGVREKWQIDYLRAAFGGMSTRKAFTAAGLDLNQDWGRYQAAKVMDPVFGFLAIHCERMQKERIRQKANGVIESCLDGDDVSRQAVRVATEIVVERGIRTDATTPAAAAPQVVINIPALPQSCCNRVANDGATVFTAKIVE